MGIEHHPLSEDVANRLPLLGFSPAELKSIIPRLSKKVNE